MACMMDDRPFGIGRLVYTSINATLLVIYIIFHRLLYHLFQIFHDVQNNVQLTFVVRSLPIGAFYRSAGCVHMNWTKLFNHVDTVRLTTWVNSIGILMCLFISAIIDNQALTGTACGPLVSSVFSY